MSLLLQRYITAKTITSLFRTYIILYSHRPTPVSPQPPRPEEILLLYAECKTPYFYFFYFLLYTLILHSITRNEYTPS